MKQPFFILFMLVLVVTGCDKYDVSSLQADSFVKFYNPRSFFMSADAKQLSTGGYALLGTVKTVSEGSQICLLLTDRFGNSVDSARYYGRRLDDKAYCLQTLHDGFAILGSSKDPQSGRLEAYFIRTDFDGDTLWTRTIGSTEDIEGYYFEVVGDTCFVMTGYIRDIVSNSKDLWIYAICENPSYDWTVQKIYGLDKDEEGRCLKVLDDGRIAVTGSTRSWPISTTTSNPFIIITNSSGNPVATIYFTQEQSPTDEEANCIRQLDDGSFLLVGSAENNGTGTDIIVRKITGLQPVEKWTLGTTGDDSGRSIIVEGNRLYILGTFSSAGGNSSINLISADLNGNNPVFTNFGEGSQMTASGFVKTSDNGFVITGSNKHSDSHASAVLIKTKDGGDL